MLKTTVTHFRKEMFKMLEHTITHNEPIHISTPNGNAVLVSEDDYNGMIETLYLHSVSKLKEQLYRDRLTSTQTFVPEDEVEW